MDGHARPIRVLPAPAVHRRSAERTDGTAECRVSPVTTDRAQAAWPAGRRALPAYRRPMQPHTTPSVPASLVVCEPDRVRYLHLVAAARATAVRPADAQQVADIVRVTVDDEVDTGTFAAIVADVATDILR
jgi:hypothetical protein